jgi:hypothetical protein
MGDMLRVQPVTAHQHYDTIRDMLSAAAYGIWATVHGTTRFTPGQLAFNRDMILRSCIEADLDLVRRDWSLLRTTMRRRTDEELPFDTNQSIMSSLLPKGTTQSSSSIKVLSRWCPKTRRTASCVQRGTYIEPSHIRLVRPYVGERVYHLHPLSLEKGRFFLRGHRRGLPVLSGWMLGSDGCKIPL